MDQFRLRCSDNKTWEIDWESEPSEYDLNYDRNKVIGWSINQKFFGFNTVVNTRDSGFKMYVEYQQYKYTVLFGINNDAIIPSRSSHVF